MDMNDIFKGGSAYDGKGSYIGPGKRLLRLISFTFAKEFEVKFLVEESTEHPVGSEVKAKWNPYKPTWQGEQDRDRAWAFLMELFALENDLALIADIAGKISTKDQTACGMLIKAVGVQGKPPTNQDGTPKLDDKGKPKKAWTEVSFYNSEGQTAETVAAGRLRIDAYKNGELEAAAATPAAAFVAPEPEPATVAHGVVLPAPITSASPLADMMSNLGIKS